MRHTQYEIEVLPHMTMKYYSKNLNLLHSRVIDVLENSKENISQIFSCEFKDTYQGRSIT